MSQKIKSPIVYKEVREVFQPWSRAQGFRRTKSRMVGWYRWHEPEVFKRRFLRLWFQVSAWDNSFTAELQLSHESRMSHYGRQRIGSVLSEAQRRAVLAREAAIRQRFSGEQVVTWERDGRTDLWLSYPSRQDVTHWAESLLEL